MFSVGKLYLVPTINGDVKYQPKTQARFFVRNDELEAGKACMQHWHCRQKFVEENSNSHQLAVGIS